MRTRQRRAPDSFFDIAHCLQNEGYLVLGLHLFTDCTYLHVRGPGEEEVGIIRFCLKPTKNRMVFWDFQPGDDPNEVLDAIRGAARVKGLSA